MSLTKCACPAVCCSKHAKTTLRTFAGSSSKNPEKGEKGEKLNKKKERESKNGGGTDEGLNVLEDGFHNFLRSRTNDPVGQFRDQLGVAFTFLPQQVESLLLVAGRRRTSRKIKEKKKKLWDFTKGSCSA